MASFDLDEPSDSQPLASNGDVRSGSSGNCSEGLGLLVWLGQLAQDESIRSRPNSVGDDSFDVPHTIGRFRLERLLGTGAYGAVFRAIDTRLGRQVALKLAWPGVLMDAVASRRFVEEPKTAASLKHRGIVEVHDSGEIEMVAFIALELVEGPTLAQWIKDQERVGVRLAAQIVRSVAEAIHFAHEREIVHRDLKPSNILLRPSERNGEFPYEPVVTDFGLARRTCVLPEMSALTATLAIVGTDRYMSPEQAAGSKDVGPASDIFSLGVILYEMVAGRRPFDGDSSEQIRQRIQVDEAPAIRPWRKGVPKDVETIALKCLEKSPQARYASAGELADDLARFLADQPIHARPCPILKKAWKYARRKPLLVSLVSLALLSALALTGLLGAWTADRISAARQIKAAEAAAAIADGLERQHQYVSNIRHAAEAMRTGRRREVLELLEQCKAIASDPVRCGIEWDFLWSRMNEFDRTLDGGRMSVHCVRFSPQGDALITAGEDGRVIVWDTISWSKRCEWNDKVGEVNVVEVSADGSLVAYGGEDGRLIVRKLADGNVAFDEPVVDGRMFALAWLSPKAEIAVGGEDAVLSVVDPVGGTRRSTERLPAITPGEPENPRPVEIASVFYIPDRDQLAVGMKPGGIQLLDASTLAPNTTFAGELLSGPYCYLRVGSGDIAAIWNDQSIRLKSLADGGDAGDCPIDQGARSLRYSQRADVLVAAFRNGMLQTWDVKRILAGSPSRGGRFYSHTGRASSAEISPDGKWLASGGQDGRIRLYSRSKMCEPFDLAIERKPSVIRFSPCGRWLAMGCGDEGNPGQFEMFDARSGKLLWTSSAVQPRAFTRNYADYQIAFSPSGNELVYLDENGVIHQRDPQTGTEISELRLNCNEFGARNKCRFRPTPNRLSFGTVRAICSWSIGNRVQLLTSGIANGQHTSARTIRCAAISG